VVVSRDVAEASQGVGRQIELTSCLLLTAEGALACALAGDFFVAGSRLSGSAGVGAALGALMLLLIYMPSL
jgi:hypothetical protein